MTRPEGDAGIVDAGDLAPSDHERKSTGSSRLEPRGSRDHGGWWPAPHHLVLESRQASLGEHLDPCIGSCAEQPEALGIGDPRVGVVGGCATSVRVGPAREMPSGDRERGVDGGQQLDFTQHVHQCAAPPLATGDESSVRDAAHASARLVS